jgi:phenolic acid decarboxylase
MRRYREDPTYPTHVVPEFARITLFQYLGPDDETVIATAPGDLPQGWSGRTN